MKGIYVCVCMLAAFCAAAMALPEDCLQVIVGTSDGWNSSHVKLSLLEKGPQGWMMVKGPFPARLEVRTGMGQGCQQPSRGRSHEEGGGFAFSRRNF